MLEILDNNKQIYYFFADDFFYIVFYVHIEPQEDV